MPAVRDISGQWDIVLVTTTGSAYEDDLYLTQNGTVIGGSGCQTSTALRCGVLTGAFSDPGLAITWRFTDDHADQTVEFALTVAADGATFMGTANAARSDTPVVMTFDITGRRAVSDAGTADAEVLDAEVLDGEVSDAEASEAGSPDSAVSDAGFVDAG